MSTWHQFLSEEGISLQKRDYTPPDKIYISSDGPEPNQEYSEYAPPGVKSKLADLIYGKYSCSNFITLFYSVPEVFAPVNEIARRVADATWQLKSNSQNEVQYNNADFNRLFSKPNPFLMMKDFVYQMVCYEILTGQVLQYLNKTSTTLGANYKDVITWSNLPSQKVFTVQRDFDPYIATEISDVVTRYEMPWKNGKRVFKVDEVIPINQFSLDCPTDFNSTKSMLVGAEKAIKNLIPVYEARGVIYIKRGALGFLVSKKSDESGLISLTKKEKLQATEDFNSTYGLSAAKNTVGITSVPLEFVKTAMSIQELQPFDETLADAAAIYTCLRVPKHLMPSKDQSTFSNADADMKAFYTDVIIPWAKRYADIWTIRFGFDRSWINPDYSHISVLQINRKEKAAVDKIHGSIWTERWWNGACSLNEWILANEGFPGKGSVYEKKLFDLTPAELEKVKEIMQLKAKPDASTEQPKVETKANGDKV